MAEDKDKQPKKAQETAKESAAKKAAPKADAKPKAETTKKSDKPTPKKAAPKAKKADASKTAKPKKAAKKDSAPKAKTDKAVTKESAKPEAAKPAPRRGGKPLVVMARAKYVRTAPRKARLVCDHIRGKSVAEARAVLAYASRAAARDWNKVLESAIANAEHNHELLADDLVVKEAYADEGPTLKRFQPRAQGRAFRIRKRTAHLTVKLTPKDRH